LDVGVEEPRRFVVIHSPFRALLTALGERYYSTMFPLGKFSTGIEVTSEGRLEKRGELVRGTGLSLAEGFER